MAKRETRDMLFTLLCLRLLGLFSFGGEVTESKSGGDGKMSLVKCLNINLLILSCCDHCSYAITTSASPERIMTT